MRNHIESNEFCGNSPLAHEVATDWHQALAALINGWSPSKSGHLSSAYVPVIDVSESADQFNVLVEVPGVASEDIELKWINGGLQVTGERRRLETEKAIQIWGERSFGRFERYLEFPCPIDSSHLSAVSKNGILQIVVPKAPEVRPRSINVQWN